MINIQIKLDNLWLRATWPDSWIKSVYIPEINLEVVEVSKIKKKLWELEAYLGGGEAIYR